MKCPDCQTELLPENINVQTDVGRCHNCQLLFTLSEAVRGLKTSAKPHDNDGFDPAQPPSGCWYRPEINQLVVGASTRSAIAFFLIPFMLVWSGGSLGGIYGTQIFNGEFDLMMSLFGIPFILGSVIFWTFALMSVAGKVELTLDSEGGTIFTGLGRIGIKKRFSWKDVRAVRESDLSVHYPGSKNGRLQLEGKTRISFGSGLNSSRRYYLLRTLQSVIESTQSSKRFF